MAQLAMKAAHYMYCTLLSRRVFEADETLYSEGYRPVRLSRFYVPMQSGVDLAGI
eukprot:CAMPEP_0119337198 /NCGR_PEP_ID=MMETSP1333-20130426/93485_1 /TAXON_ID=418940 /ORGANISM="Scyphosphaera apsteinii, Strain RCC1455" /LENGTH=54 /DNA_ID=CAMNT_0007348191 /DNA_START=276 /DNA_END=437 /DNA_ORIENTATION=+